MAKVIVFQDPTKEASAGKKGKSEKEAENVCFASLSHRVKFQLEVCNFTNWLFEPCSTVVRSGQISMPQGVILPGDKEIMQGHKVHLSTHGACGVACWRVDCSRSLMAVMYSCPLHFSFWNNWMAIGIFPDTMEINRELFDLMYRGIQDERFIRRSFYKEHTPVNFENDDFHIIGTMGSSHKPIIKVSVFPKKLNDLAPSLRNQVEDDDLAEELEKQD